MSSPQVAGSLFLLQELYAKQNDGQFMRSATLRGLAIHTAEDAGNVVLTIFMVGVYSIWKKQEK
jgi:hypothetical protein